MERPSHINLRSSQPVPTRLALLGVAVFLPFALVWGFDHGMVAQAFKDFGPLTMVPVDQQPVKPQTPPPAPKLLNIARPVIEAPPLIQIAPEQTNGINASVPPVQTRQPEQTATPVVGPDRAAVGIAATHTIPPYPLLAQRLGKEGKVTLRLTVLPDGRVGKADVVTSSGSADLDSSAQEWIVAHWTYKPALDKGQPTASQTTATVVFSLSDQR